MGGKVRKRKTKMVDFKNILLDIKENPEIEVVLIWFSFVVIVLILDFLGVI